MKRIYTQGAAPCAGTCGRMLRSTKTTKEEFPGTVRRYRDGMCESCCKTLSISQDRIKQGAIRACKNCQHPTRPQTMKSSDAPGTRKRVGDLCRNCDSACEWVAPEVVDAAVESLEAYIRARRARGVPAEGRPAYRLAS